MRRNRFKLTESALVKMIRNSVRQVLTESNNDREKQMKSDWDAIDNSTDAMQGCLYHDDDDFYSAYGDNARNNKYSKALDVLDFPYEEDREFVGGEGNKPKGYSEFDEYPGGKTLHTLGWMDDELDYPHNDNFFDDSFDDTIDGFFNESIKRALKKTLKQY